jgi:hypothetical protein
LVAKNIKIIDATDMRRGQEFLFKIVII